MLGNLLSSTEATVVVASSGLLLSFLFGTWTPLLTALLVFQVIDIITGIMVGGKKREISSESFFDGFKKKVGMWLLLIVANIIDVTLVGGVPAMKSAVSGLLIAGEGMSLLENLTLLGVPIPKKVTKFFEQLKEDSDKEESE